VWLVAHRIILRTRGPGTWLRVTGLLGLLALIAGALLLVTGRGGVATLALFGFGAFASLIAAILRYLVPTIAVSALGIAFGVAALFTVMAVTSGFEAELLRGTGRLNGNLLVTKYGLDFFEYEDTAAHLERRPEVKASSPFAWGMVTTSRIEGELAVGEPVVAAVKGIDPARVGRFAGFDGIFSGGDASRIAPGNLHLEAPSAAVGRRLANELGIEIGDELRVVAPREIDGSSDPFAKPPRAATFKVVDLLDTGIADLDDQLVLVHLRAAQSLLFGEGRVTGIELELEEAALSAELAPVLTAALNPGQGPILYRCMDWAAGSTPVLVMRNVRQLVSLILSLIVLVAGSTLVGALLLIIRRRRKQIAMLATLGASRLMLFSVFEAAGLSAGIVGAAGGLALGALCCWALAIFRWPLDASVYPIDYLPVEPRLVDALVPCGVALLVCALLSGPAAIGAARLPLLASLRGR
jgi:lipoprotein-releasing system permease protein